MTEIDLAGSFGLRVGDQDVEEVSVGGACAGKWQARTNLATNPSFETTSGTVTVATTPDRIPDPSFEAQAYDLGTGWAYDTTVARTGTTSARTNTTASGVYSFTLRQWLPVRQGQVWSFSAWYKTSEDYAPRDASNTKVHLGNDDGTGTDSPAGIPVFASTPTPEWTRISHQWTVAAPHASATGPRRQRLTVVHAVATGQLWLDDVEYKLLYDPDPLTLPSFDPEYRGYFDGDTKPVLRTNLALGWAVPTFEYQYPGQATSRVIEGGREYTIQSPGVTLRHPFQYVPQRRYTATFSIEGFPMQSVRIRRESSTAGEVVATPDPIAGTRWYVTFTAPSTEPLVNAGLYLYSSNAVVGSVAQFTDVDIYEGDYDPAREFVAPGQSDSTGLVCEWTGAENASPSIVVDPDFTTAWTGEAGASTSVLRGVGVAGAEGFNAHRLSSTRWMVSGSRSLRIMPHASTTASAWANGNSGKTTNFLPGRTYRASARLHLVAPLTAPTQGTRMSMFYRNSSNAEVVVNGPIVPNVAGTQIAVHTFSIPGDAQAGGSLIIYNGAARGGGDLWVDDLIIEDITDGAPEDDFYFDGSTPDSPAALHRWTGTPHASTSVATLAWQPTT